MCDLRRRNPDLATRNYVVVALARRLGLDVRGIEARIGLGDGEACLLLSADQRRQEALLLLGRAEHHHRVEPENIHMNRRGAAEAGTGLRDRLHHHRRL